MQTWIPALPQVEERLRKGGSAADVGCGQGLASLEMAKALHANSHLGRVWYHLLCSEIDAAAVWYEKMIEAREIFAPICARYLYSAELRASPYWPKLARVMKLPDSAP